MITGKDLSYCSYGDNSIIGNLALEDVITNSEVVIDTHYAYANCAGITSLSSCSYTINRYTYTYDYSYKETRHIDNITYIDTYNCYYYQTYTYLTNYKETSLGYVSNMSGMFLGAYNIKTADLSKVNISLCNNMDCMFADCKSLETIKFGEYIPHVNLHCVDIFKNCYNLETVYIPSSLKKEYSNISSAALSHTIYYNHSDIALENISYTYLKNISTQEQYRTIKFILKHIGAFIVEDEINWDMIKIQLNGTTIFYMNYGEYRPTDSILRIKKHVLLNDYYPTNKKLYVNVDNIQSNYVIAELTVDVLYKYTVQKMVRANIYVPTNQDEYNIDIDSIYVTEDENIYNTIKFVEEPIHTYTYVRWNPSVLRGNFNRTQFEYNFPDGDLIKEIDAQTMECSYVVNKIIGSYAYTFNDMKPIKKTLNEFNYNVLDAEVQAHPTITQYTYTGISYLTQLDNKNISN